MEIQTGIWGAAFKWCRCLSFSIRLTQFFWNNTYDFKYAGLVFLLVLISYRHLALYAIVMMLGAFCWFVGNGIWLLGLPIYKVIIWWIGFLVLTIAGERLELSRILHLSKENKLIFILAVSVFIIGALLAIKIFGIGVRIASIGMIVLALWLLRNDIARRTIHKSGLSRFMAVSLLLGYIWLVKSGILGLLFEGTTAGFYYDAILHSIFVGFVFSMIFPHAPIIFPTVMGLPKLLPFQSWFYVHLTLLHLSAVFTDNRRPITVTTRASVGRII